MPIRVSLIVFVAVLSACAPESPRVVIDGSTPATFTATTRAAREQLTAADRLEFDRALASVPARRYADGDPEARARITFDGLTAAQVVEDQRRR